MALGLSKRLVGRRLADPMDSLPIVLVVPGHELICPQSIPLLGDLNVLYVRNGTPREKGDLALLRKPLSQRAARIEVVDLGWNDFVFGGEIHIIFIHRQASP